MFGPAGVVSLVLYLALLATGAVLIGRYGGQGRKQRGKHADERAYCAKCGFDLIGLWPPTDTDPWICTECGQRLRDAEFGGDGFKVTVAWKRAVPNRRLAILGHVFMVGAFVFFFGQMWLGAAMGSNSLWPISQRPIGVVRLQATLDDMSSDKASDELARRIASRSLSNAQVDDLVLLALREMRSNRRGDRHPWFSADWGDVILAAHEQNRVSDAQMFEAIEASGLMAAHTSASLTVGDELLITLSGSDDFFGDLPAANSEGMALGPRVVLTRVDRNGVPIAGDVPVVYELDHVGVVELGTIYISEPWRLGIRPPPGRYRIEPLEASWRGAVTQWLGSRAKPFAAAPGVERASGVMPVTFRGQASGAAATVHVRTVGSMVDGLGDVRASFRLDAQGELSLHVRLDMATDGAQPNGWVRQPLRVHWLTGGLGDRAAEVELGVAPAGVGVVEWVMPAPRDVVASEWKNDGTHAGRRWPGGPIALRFGLETPAPGWQTVAIDVPVERIGPDGGELSAEAFRQELQAAAER